MDIFLSVLGLGVILYSFGLQLLLSLFFSPDGEGIFMDGVHTGVIFYVFEGSVAYAPAGRGWSTSSVSQRPAGAA